MKAYVNTKQSGRDLIVAICDEEVLDREFKEGNVKLCANKSFYNGKLVDINELEYFMISATILNIIGKNSVEKAITLGLVDEKNVLKIGGTVHAQMIRM
ncbi:MAG: DUF424 domain-containing protein [Candidatus Methanofastidiosia archaeon]